MQVGTNAVRGSVRASATDASEMSRLARNYDWSQSPLGPRSSWPTSLSAAFELILPAQAEIVIFAGPEFVALYNDAYAPTIGDKHPHAFGRPAQEYWTELWSDLRPLLDHVLSTAETISAKDRPFQIERHGYPEQVFFDISYSPIREPSGEVVGVLCIVNETTERIRATADERRLAAIIASTDDAILGTDLDMMVTSWNRGAEDLYGYTAEEIVGTPVMRLVPADRPDEEVALMAQVRAGERVAPHDTKRVHKNGTLLDVSLTVSPIVDDQGRIVGASKIARDISARKEAEHLQQVLTGELQHRVKNTLATVQAIARQTFRGEEHASAAVFYSRLTSLANAHDLLTRGSWDGADLEAVVSGVVAPYSAAQFEIAGASVRLTSRSVLATSLALHELATNAVKYGALSVPEGLVQVTWHLCQHAHGPGFELVWRERGGPKLAQPERQGFGSVLVQQVLPQELQGEVAVSYDPEGLVCTIRAPLIATWEQTVQR